MFPLNVQKISDIVTGRGNCSHKHKTPVLKVETDTRHDLTSAVFIALKGDNFDGHNFINEAFDKGAVCVISEREEDLKLKKPVVLVDSTYKALRDLAKHHIAQLKLPVVAVTGSVGKTTTKDMIASVLSTKYKTFKSEGNFNNAVGLPLEALKLDASYQAAVFELGMSAPGEIHKLAEVVMPDVCVITNVGYSHIENLGSREEILKAKMEILDFKKDTDQIILNGNDDMLITLKDKYKNIRYFGFGQDNFIRADSIREDSLWGISCFIHYDDNRFFVKIPLPGKHTLLNALAAAAVGCTLNIDPSSIKNGLENFRPSKLRMDIANAPGGITVINDTYNAAPASMMAAIDVLSVVKTRKVCVLGDMLELGQDAPRFHYDIGAYAAKKGIDIILCAGELAGYIYKGALDFISPEQETEFFMSRKELFERLNNYIKEGDTVLVKASRALKLEEVAVYLGRQTYVG